MPQRSSSSDAATTDSAAGGEGGGSTLLAVGAGVPAAMRRPVWRFSDYRIGARLYRGEVSSVYKATCLHSGMRVVLKVYDLQRVPENAVHTIVREIRIHTDLVHPNILALYGVFEEHERAVLVLESAARGDLFRIHRELPGCRMNEDQLRALVLVPLLESLAYLHSRGICHRDIKPENLLLTADWKLRVADLGAAIDLNAERAVTRTGTMEYMAPEVCRCPLKAGPYDNKDVPGLAYSTAADVWSVGILAFEMLVGFPPCIQLPCGRRVSAAADAGVAGLSFPNFVSAGGQDFITLALAERAGDRPTAAQLLRHPWLKHAVRIARASTAAAAAAAAAAQPPPAPSAAAAMSLRAAGLATAIAVATATVPVAGQGLAPVTAPQHERRVASGSTSVGRMATVREAPTPAFSRSNLAVAI
ncbi:hypothetical protein GPECTOR_16g601 [Gonium pectorale]|uniref:Protein kinase domain-containing protein n=1 Tax=Gonium pectorale TaxID=33097 RepID=A0A150GKW2_GONPE|nr:hypothetical protein GPECTOR_16g601 [Gonium pectorale]|eukprot:KXZ50427.1 hypothetical protein GPECTOR_16g601 [Gonium pectorale]